MSGGGRTVSGMCGRFSSARPSTDLAVELDAEDVTGGDVPGRYNTAPTQLVRVVTGGEAGRRLEAAKWGLVPFWAKDPKVGTRMINARAETAAAKPAYRDAVRRMRALVPMDGWFEWLVGPDGVKTPRYMTPGDGGLLTAAGLYSWWDSGIDPPMLTCTILTTAAVGRLREVHERMPLLLPAGARDAWLGSPGDAAGMLTAPPSAELVDGLEIRRVDRAVGRVANNGPELLTAITDRFP